MRRALAIGLIGFALTLLSARPASAQWAYFRWLQALSGPGDFNLNGFVVTFGCVENGSTAQTNRENSSPAPVRYVFCDKSSRWRHVKRFMGATYALGDGKNNLEYPEGVEKLERVKASIYTAMGAFRWKEWIDAGASGGFMRFTGTPDVVVTRFLIEPFVAVRPLAFLDKDPNSTADRVARAVELNLALVIFPQGFRLSDFGAIAGPEWSGKTEAVLRVGFRAQFAF
jgi:hypothetical protein